MGAVHDFGVLVISLRHKGRSICDFADQFVSKKVQLIFFIIVCFALWIVIAIFGLIIAIVFDLFPQSVIPVWFEIPVAIFFGYTLRRFPSKLLILSIIALLLMTFSVIFGHYFPISLPSFWVFQQQGFGPYFSYLCCDCIGFTGSNIASTQGLYKRLAAIYCNGASTIRYNYYWFYSAL